MLDKISDQEEQINIYEFTLTSERGYCESCDPAIINFNNYVRNFENLAFLTYISRNRAGSGETGGVIGYQFPFIDSNIFYDSTTY